MRLFIPLFSVFFLLSCIGLSRADIICPGGSSSCPSRNTCCPDPDGSYDCCPYSHGSCCTDGNHCCPSGYTCSDSGDTCHTLTHHQTQTQTTGQTQTSHTPTLKQRLRVDKSKYSTNTAQSIIPSALLTDAMRHTKQQQQPTFPSEQALEQLRQLENKEIARS